MIVDIFIKHHFGTHSLVFVAAGVLRDVSVRANISYSVIIATSLEIYPNTHLSTRMHKSLVISIVDANQ